jgi:hypothetical protein
MVRPNHIHHNGRCVYVGNHACGQIEKDGKKFAAGGESTIAIFAIDRASLASFRPSTPRL